MVAEECVFHCSVIILPLPLSWPVAVFISWGVEAKWASSPQITLLLVNRRGFSGIPFFYASVFA